MTKDESRARTASSTGGPVLPLVREAYPRVAKHLLRPLLELLASARRVCGGDGQKGEILLRIAFRCVEHPEFAKLDYELLASGKAEAYPSLGTNIRSIADSAEMSRETVRRKVAELLASGLVTREGRRLALSPPASLALGPFRDALLRLTVANHELVVTLLTTAPIAGRSSCREQA